MGFQDQENTWLVNMNSYKAILVTNVVGSRCSIHFQVRSNYVSGVSTNSNGNDKHERIYVIGFGRNLCRHDS